jgi:hypothetical protein
MKISEISPCHENIPNIILLLSISSSTPPLVDNMNVNNVSYSIHAILISINPVQYTPFPGYIMYSIQHVLYTVSVVYTKFGRHSVVHQYKIIFTPGCNQSLNFELLPELIVFCTLHSHDYKFTN